jgi:anthranilate synthase/phosphoribosyltransferase
MILLIDNYDSFVYNVYQLMGEVLQEERLQKEKLQKGNLLNEKSQKENLANEKLQNGIQSKEDLQKENKMKEMLQKGKLQKEKLLEEMLENMQEGVGSVENLIHVVRNDQITIEEIEALAPTHIVISPGPGRPENAGICEEVIRHFGKRIPILGICLGHQAICQVFGAQITYARSLMHGKQSSIYLDVGSKIFEGMEKRILAGRYHSLAADPDSMPEVLRVTARAEKGEVMGVQHVSYPIYGIQFHPESVLTPDGKQILKNFLLPPKAAAKPVKDAIKDAICLLAEGQDIGYALAKDVMKEIMEGRASDIQKSAYLTALSIKGATIEEITGSAEEMRSHCLGIDPGMEVLEIVGTGGDHSNSFNISTTASLLISTAGVPVAKHGNRAASSKSGAADCLEALGVNILLSPEQNQKLLKEIGICFLFAQKYHSAMKYVAPVRGALGIRTIFNILGPLASPARASLQIMGVYDEKLLLPLAKVLSNLGVKRGMVVYGRDRLDEISICAPTAVCEIKDGEFLEYEIKPEDFGMRRWDPGALTGGTPLQNGEITRAILMGEPGAKRDAAVLNAGAALYIAGRATDIRGGVEIANDMIDSGKALRQLEEFVRLSNE